MREAKRHWLGVRSTLNSWHPPSHPPVCHPLRACLPPLQVLEILEDSVVRRLSEVQQENAVPAVPHLEPKQKQQEQLKVQELPGGQAAAALQAASVLRSSPQPS